VSLIYVEGDNDLPAYIFAKYSRLDITYCHIVKYRGVNVHHNIGCGTLNLKAILSRLKASFYLQHYLLQR
jgi:hypothetical protein